LLGSKGETLRVSSSSSRVHDADSRSRSQSERVVLTPTEVRAQAGAGREWSTMALDCGSSGFQAAASATGESVSPCVMQSRSLGLTDGNRDGMPLGLCPGSEHEAPSKFGMLIYGYKEKTESPTTQYDTGSSLYSSPMPPGGHTASCSRVRAQIADSRACVSFGSPPAHVVCCGPQCNEADEALPAALASMTCAEGDGSPRASRAAYDGADAVEATRAPPGPELRACAHGAIMELRSTPHRMTPFRVL